MNKIKITILSVCLFSTFSMAKNEMEFEAEKVKNVNIHQGISKDELIKKMSCMVCLKKHKTMQEALKAKKEEIDHYCKEYDLEEKECKKMKKKIAKYIWQCFTGKEFMKEFIIPQIMEK